MKLPIVFVVLFASLSCFAGEIDSPEVSITTVSPTQTTATGSLLGARLSNDTTQLISCTNTIYKTRMGSVKRAGKCQAIDSNGSELACSTLSSFYMDIIGSINASSIVTFTTDTSAYPDDNCHTLTVENTSTSIL